MYAFNIAQSYVTNDFFLLLPTRPDVPRRYVSARYGNFAKDKIRETM
jgi:hypothetical protein